MTPKTVQPSSVSSSSLPNSVPSRSAMPATAEPQPAAGEDDPDRPGRRDLGPGARSGRHAAPAPVDRAGRWLRVERGQVVVTLEGDGHGPRAGRR